MHGGDAGDDDEATLDASGTPISPYLPPQVPSRRSVIPPSKEQFTFPSGLVARPVEDYLSPSIPSDAADATSAPHDGPAKAEATPEPWPFGERDGSDSGDGGPRGPWGLPRWAIWAGFGVLAIVIGLVAWRGGSSSGPSPNGSSSPTGSAGPDVPSYFDDGISEAEYPAAAEDRGEGYPEALQMAEWVWDRVGPQWAIVLFAERPNQDQDSQPLPTSVVYLVSPEGVYFELSELPARVANGATLVSWHEDERTARIVWEAGTRGGLLHLETGEVEDTSFTMRTGQTKEISFLAGDSAGKEIWVGWSSDLMETKISAWTPESGWETILAGQDDLYIEWYVNPTNVDSSAVVFQIYTVADSLFTGDRSLQPGVPNFVVYSLESGENHRFIPDIPLGSFECWYNGWIDSVSVVYSCWDDVESVQQDYRILVDGSDSVLPYTPEVLWFSDLLGRETVRHPNAPIEFVVDPDLGTVMSVRVLKGDKAVTVIDEGLLGANGKSILRFDEVAPGVFRMVTWDQCVIGIDTAAATISPMILTEVDGVPLMAPSYVFFGEATPSGVGLVWGD